MVTSKLEIFYSETVHINKNNDLQSKTLLMDPNGKTPHDSTGTAAIVCIELNWKGEQRIRRKSFIVWGRKLINGVIKKSYCSYDSLVGIL